MENTAVSDRAKAIYAAAVALPKEDRGDLIDALIVSLHEEPAVPFSAEWREEIDRRIAQIDRGEVTLIPWEETRRKARELLGD